MRLLRAQQRNVAVLRCAIGLDWGSYVAWRRGWARLGDGLGRRVGWMARGRGDVRGPVGDFLFGQGILGGSALAMLDNGIYIYI